jgi:cellulose synthase/poly-beta-1,6-N-acetylglucosamine synthase-like glycosyltransferase
MRRGHDPAPGKTTGNVIAFHFTRRIGLSSDDVLENFRWRCIGWSGMFIQTVLISISLVLTLLFFLYGFDLYYLLIAARRYRTPALPDHSTVRPVVSIHLPVYNEKYVIRRVVDACASMAEAYGKENVSILILDDSNDETVLEVDKVVEEYKKQHIQIEVMRRGCRDGFKAGALQSALNRTDEEFIAIFDADFVPPADFLLRTIPYFDQNENLGIVQSRWTHLNRNYNLLTQALSHAIDVHFLVEQPGRYTAGIFQNFNGSGGVLRKKAILEAGGWQADTLAEDLDLSYRMQALGYRIIYLRDLFCPGEIPPTIPNVKQQQGRWACGALRTARKILPGLLQNQKIGFRQRIQAFIHLTGYMIQPLMVIAFVLSLIAAFWGVNIFRAPQLNTVMSAYATFFATQAAMLIFLQNLVWFSFAVLIALCTLAPWISLISILKVQNLSLAQNLASLLVLLLVSIGISLGTTRGVGRGLFTNRDWDWTRTPKYADLQNKKDWRQSNYQVPLDFLWMLELMFVLLGLWAIGTAIRHSDFNVLIILIPFTLSYGFVLVLSILQSRRGKVT